METKQNSFDFYAFDGDFCDAFVETDYKSKWLVLTDDVFAFLLFQSINSIFEAQGWDFEVTSGEISSVTVGIPWNCLMSEDSYVEVNNLRLCLRPQPRAKDDGKYF